MAALDKIRKIKLNSGYEMPVLGLGTWESVPGELTEIINYALDKGIRHFDLAPAYKNQKEVGTTLAAAFKEGKVKREDLFITSKLFNGFHDPAHVEEAIDITLAELQLDYLDLYLIHWPISHQYPGKGNVFTQNDPATGFRYFEPVPIHATWPCLEKLVAEKKVRSIGVANFPAILIQDLLTYAKIPPAVDQIELHPYNQDWDTINYLTRQGIHVTGFSPLGRLGMIAGSPSILQSEVMQKIAAKHKKSIPQCALKWGLTRHTNISLIPKTTIKTELDQNIDIFDFELDADDFAQIKTLNRGYRFTDPRKLFNVPIFGSSTSDLN